MTDAPRGQALRFIEDAATQVTLEVDAVAAGLVVLADAHARGWEAQVDGEAARILATNHLFRGVVVPAGRHRVTFVYSAPGLGIGALFSVLGLLGFLGLGGLLRPEAWPTAQAAREAAPSS